MIRTIINTLALLLMLIFLNSCGSGSGQKWGIDSEVLLPICNGDKNTTTNAVNIIANQVIEPKVANTVVLLWHFDNGTKKACVATGKAVVREP